jgi:hypothetical protein
VSRCGYIIPPNLYPKTHVLKKDVDPPTKKQSSATHCCKNDGGNRGKDSKKGNSDLNRSCETLPPSAFDRTITGD